MIMVFFQCSLLVCTMIWKIAKNIFFMTIEKALRSIVLAEFFFWSLSSFKTFLNFHPNNTQTHIYKFNGFCSLMGMFVGCFLVFSSRNSLKRFLYTTQTSNFEKHNDVNFKFINLVLQCGKKTSGKWKISKQ
jgi:hypothetical protein